MYEDEDESYSVDVGELGQNVISSEQVNEAAALPPDLPQKRKTSTLLDHFPKKTRTTDDVIEIDGSSGNSNESQVPTNKSDCKLTEKEQQMADSTGSLVWFYFKKQGIDSAKCNICSAPRSTPTGTTKTLITHLKSHAREYSQFEKVTAARKMMKEKNIKTGNEVGATKKSESGIVTLKGKFGVLPSTSKRAQEITKAMAIWICKGLHAYSEVNEPGFRYLLWKIEPRYVIPHRTTFSRNIIPKLFQTEKEKQLTYLNNNWKYIESVTITTDGWSSRAQDPFLSSTMQFIVNKAEENEDIFVLIHLTLDLIPFTGSHSADRICEEGYKMLKSTNVDTTSVNVYINTDNDSKMLAAFEQPTAQKTLNERLPDVLRGVKPWTHLKCVDHTLQLAIGDARKAIGVNSIIEKVIAIVNRYSWSNIARENLHKKQVESGTVQHELVKNVVTRWNSEFLMMQRFLEQKVPITMELLDAGEENLTSQQWKMVEGYVEVLRPIASFTAELGSTKQPTLSMVIPVLFEIQQSLDDFTKKHTNKGAGIQFARALLKNVRERFPDCDYRDDPTYQLATLVDPRFKDLLLSDKNKAVKLLEDAALEKHRQNIRRGRVLPTTNDNQETSSSTSVPVAKKSKWGHLQNIQRNVDLDILDISNIISSEVKTYLAMPIIDADNGDPLLWWKANRNSFPHLVFVAAQYLGIAATEVQSERDNSVGGNTVTSKRTNLSPQHVREIVFLHRNLVVPAVPDKNKTDSSLFYNVE